MAGRKRNPDAKFDDLSSEFDYQSEVDRKRKKKNDFIEKEYPGEPEKLKRGDAKKTFQDEHGRLHRQMNRLMCMTAYERHKQMMNLYHLCYEGATKKFERDASNDRTDYDVLKDNHKFLWTSEELAEAGGSYASRLAKKYYDQLFKEYCIVDLSRYKEGKVAMRWRTEAEVKSGKGHVICASRKCDDGSELSSWEVNFAYVEAGERKNALVKLRLCLLHSMMLNHRFEKKKAQKKPSKWSRKEKKKGDSDDVTSNLSLEKLQREETSKPSTSTKAVWEAPVQQEVVRTIDEDIDEFLNDIFE